MAKLSVIAVVVLSVLGITGCGGAPRAIQGQRYDPADVEVRPASPAPTRTSGAISPGYARLTGKVSDESGSRLVGASVEVRRGDGAGDAVQTATDLRGFYSFDLEAGSWRVLVTQLGYCPEFTTVRIRSMEEHAADLSLRAINDC